jgi:hypothetical protein
MNTFATQLTEATLSSLFGTPVKLAPTIEVGAIVAGVDKSYRRSLYEVLAKDGVYLLLLFRRFGGDERPTVYFEDINKMSLYLRPAIMFEATTDHLLKPSGVKVVKTSWGKETGWDVQYTIDGSLVHRVTEIPYCKQ